MCPGCRFVLTVTWALDGIQNEIGSERPLSTFGGCHGVDVGCWLRARDWGRPGGWTREVTGGTDFAGLLLRGEDGRTAEDSCGCGARAIHGQARR